MGLSLIEDWSQHGGWNGTCGEGSTLPPRNGRSRMGDPARYRIASFVFDTSTINVIVLRKSSAISRPLIFEFNAGRSINRHETSFWEWALLWTSWSANSN